MFLGGQKNWKKKSWKFYEK